MGKKQQTVHLRAKAALLALIGFSLTAAGTSSAESLFDGQDPRYYSIDGDTVTLHNAGVINSNVNDGVFVGNRDGQGLIDFTEFSAPSMNLVINWDANTTDVPKQYHSDGGSVRNSTVNVKNLTVNSVFEGDSWNNKGISTSPSTGYSGLLRTDVSVAGNITVNSRNYAVFSDTGHLENSGLSITGFQNLSVKSIEVSALYNAASSTMTISGAENSTIDLTNTSIRKPVIGDQSSGGISVTGGTIKVYSDTAHALIATKSTSNPTLTSGRIAIEAAAELQIGTEGYTRDALYSHDSGSASGYTSGISMITLNKTAQGKVIVYGNIHADSQSGADVVFAGDDSSLTGNIVTDGNSNIASDFAGAGSQMTGDIRTNVSDTGASAVSADFSGADTKMTGSISAGSASTVNADFSGKNSSMTGNITAGDSSTVSQTLSGVNAKMTGNIAAAGSSSITAELSGENTSMTGNITASGSSTVSQTLSGVNAKMTGDIAAAGSSSITAELSGENTSMNGNITASDSSTANFRASGRNSLLNGTVTASGGTVSARFTGSGSGWNGDLVNTGGTADISLTSASWYGNMNAQSGTTNLALDSGSTWTGAADTASGAQASVTISSGAAWNVTADSSLTSLVLSAGGHLSMEGAANKLRIGSLTAPAAVSGTLHMDLVYHDNNLSTYENASDSDFLYVDSGSGATFLVEPTRSSTLNNMSDSDRLYFAQTGIGSSAFQVNQEILLMNSNRLYDKNLLVKNDQNTTADGYEDWYLTTNTEHEPDSDELNPNGRVPGSAYTAALAVWRDSDTLLKRLGELRYSREEQGTWARYSRRKLEKEHDHTFTTKLNALQIGYDTKRTGEKGDWYYGAAVEHVWGDSDYDYGFGYGNGDTKMTDLTLYGTSLRRSGHYLDLAARVGRIDSDYEVTYGDGGDTGDFDNWAFSIGAEYGRKSSLGKDWYWEWQSQLTYSYVWGDSYTTANGARISQDNFDSLVGRLGLVLSREFNTDSAAPGRVYAKASLQHEFLGDSSERLYDGVIFYDSEDLDDTWYTVGFGANLKLSGNCDLYLDAERDFDAVIKNKYRFECGVRFEF